MPGEFEPNDSRNVTGTASTPDGRWTAQGGQPPEANGQSPRPAAQGGGGAGSGGISQDGAGDMSEDTGDQAGSGVRFTPDDELNRKVGADGGVGGLSNEGAGEDMENRKMGSESGSNQRGAGGNTFTGGSGGQAGNSQAGFGQQNSGTEASQQQQFDQGRGQMSGGQNAGSLGEQIREHMSVVDAEGTQVGTVDAYENDQIKLTRSGSSDGQHHYLPIDRVAGIEGDTIRLHDSGDSVFGSNGS